jgi:pimeloyl-ACP methyl ester carboxylesterase
MSRTTATGRNAALAVAALAAALLVPAVGRWAMADEAVATVGRIRSFDGVEIVYSERGAGETALVLIHGGLANRSFWAPQLAALSATYRVVALDLGGHGESGRERTAWTIAAFAADVRSVVAALDLRRIVLVGNSLGGAVALDAAALLPGRAIGVVGVDTLHLATQTIPVEAAKARADVFRKDFGGSCHAMVEQLLHPGSYPELRAWAEREMKATSPAVAAGMLEAFGGYDLAAAFRAAGVPIRAINGDLWPTDVAANRAVTPDFDAVIMKNAGHYPMLERPEEFDRLLAGVVADLAARTAPR